MSGEGYPGDRIVIGYPDSDVELRQLVPEDAQDYFDLVDYDRDHLRQFGEGTGDKYYSPEEVRASIVDPPEPDKLRFGIWHEGEASGEDTMVGSINLTPMGVHGGTGERMAALGWWVGKEHIGHRYATKACPPLIDYAFDTLGVDLLFCKIHTDNTASRRTAEAAGFVYESTSEGNIATYVLRRPADGSEA